MDENLGLVVLDTAWVGYFLCPILIVQFRVIWCTKPLLKLRFSKGYFFQNFQFHPNFFYGKYGNQGGMYYRLLLFGDMPIYITYSTYIAISHKPILYVCIYVYLGS